MFTSSQKLRGCFDGGRARGGAHLRREGETTGDEERIRRVTADLIAADDAAAAVLLLSSRSIESGSKEYARDANGLFFFCEFVCRREKGEKRWLTARLRVRLAGCHVIGLAMGRAGCGPGPGPGPAFLWAHSALALAPAGLITGSGLTRGDSCLRECEQQLALPMQVVAWK